MYHKVSIYILLFSITFSHFLSKFYLNFSFHVCVWIFFKFNNELRDSTVPIKRHLLYRKFDKGSSTLVHLPVGVSGASRSAVCPTKSRGRGDYGRHAEGNTSRFAELRRVLYNISGRRFIVGLVSTGLYAPVSCTRETGKIRIGSARFVYSSD